MKNGLCHLKILETLQFPRALGSCKRGGCKHRATQLPSRDPSTWAKRQQQDKAIWGHIPVTPASPRALLPALSTQDGWALLVRCSGQRKGLPAAGARGTVPCTRAGEN